MAQPTVPDALPSFAEHPLASPLATRSTSSSSGKALLYDQFGTVMPPTDDPGWQKPGDPLEPGVAEIIHREIPNSLSQTLFSVNDIRNAIGDLVIGQFDRPAQLADVIMADSRVVAAMGSRVGGVFGRPARFRIKKKYRGSRIARECRDAWAESWVTMNATAAFSEMHRWGIMLGFWIGQLIWDHSGKWSVPIPVTWHPRYTWYHWLYRVFVAVSMDGLVPVTPGDGHWVLHAPYGAYRGWFRAVLWSIADWVHGRKLTLRDQLRYNERHGLPIFKAKSPAGALPKSIDRWRQQLRCIGQEAVIHLPQGVDKQYSYDVEMMEASDQAYLAFKTAIDQMGSEVILAILWQNLMTEVKEGSYAAARMHGDVRETAVELDENADSHTVNTQIAPAFALNNFGDADLAPVTHWPVRPEEDQKTRSETFSTFAKGLSDLRTAGVKPKKSGIRQIARYMGMRLGAFDLVDPIQVAASVAKATGKESKDT